MEAGFAVYEDVVSAAEVVALTAALRTVPRSRAGSRHLMGRSDVAFIARDRRLLRLAQAVAGADAQPFRATLFDKSPGANWLVVWHQDTALPIRERRDVSGWGPWSTKAGVLYAHAPAPALEQIVALRLHLDDSTEENGPLRVLPGTQGLGVLTDATIRELAGRVAPAACVVRRGGVVAMRPLVVHSSSRARTDAPRRVLHIEYAASFILESGLELAIA